MVASFGCGTGAHQQPRARHRRERHRRQKLGIVTTAGSLISVGPAVIENVFAVGVRLRIERDDTIDLAIGSGERQVLRRPAGTRCRRAALFERVEESVRNGWVDLAGAGVPRSRRNFGYRRMHADRYGAANIVHRPSAPFFGEVRPMISSIVDAPCEPRSFALTRIGFASPLSSMPQNRLVVRPR